MSNSYQVFLKSHDEEYIPIDKEFPTIDLAMRFGMKHFGFIIHYSKFIEKPEFCGRLLYIPKKIDYKNVMQYLHDTDSVLNNYFIVKGIKNVAII
jgi:hypothetical protein